MNFNFKKKPVSKDQLRIGRLMLKQGVTMNAETIASSTELPNKRVHTVLDRMWRKDLVQGKKLGYWSLTSAGERWLARNAEVKL